MKLQLSTSLPLLALVSVTTHAQDVAIPSVNQDLRYFADDLTQQLYNMTNAQQENHFTSSFGISLAMSLIYPAAVDMSYDQFRDVLGFPPSNMQLVWADTAAALQSTYTGECITIEETSGECRGNRYHPELVIASKIYVDNDQALDATYEGIVNGDDTMVESVESIDMDDDSAGSIINEWVANATKGKIESIVDEGPLDGLDAAVLTALYLKASWRYPFEADYTTVDTFYDNAQKLTAVNEAAQFMHMVEYDMVYSDTAIEGFQILQLPFRSRLSLILALPTMTTTATDNGMMVSSEDVLGVLPEMTRQRVAISLPKFTVEASYEDELETAMKTLGLTEPMSPLCNTLCVFQGTCEAYISKLVHKTFLDVNEGGIEAAAVTVVGTGLMFGPMEEDPVLFQADHPFQLFVYDAAQDLVLFEGRIGNPMVGPNTPTPTLQASHADESFWMDQFYVMAMANNMMDPMNTGVVEEEAVNATEPTEAMVMDDNNVTSMTDGGDNNMTTTGDEDTTVAASDEPMNVTEEDVEASKSTTSREVPTSASVLQQQSIGMVGMAAAVVAGLVL